MTPKEKAKNIVDKYLNADFNCKDCKTPYCEAGCTELSVQEAKQCALIAVEEILSNSCEMRANPLFTEPSAEIFCDEEYWHSVKLEIQNL